MEETVGIIAVFGFVPVIVWIVTYFRSKAHERATNVMKLMVDRGEEITPEKAKALGVLPSSPHKDLKTGMILIAVSVAFVIFGNVIPDPSEDARQVFTGIASFPFLVGVVYVVFWFMFARKEQDI